MIQVRSNYLFLSFYLLFIIYGSLFPLADWRTSEQSLRVVWQHSLGQHISRSDLLTNFLVYIPLGFLLSSVSSARFGRIARILLVVSFGILFSLTMEYLQLFLPARTSSPLDLLLNSLSTLCGALLFNWLGRESTLGVLLGKWRENRFTSGRTVDIGLAVMLLWGATQLAPIVPSLDFGGMKNGIKPLWQTVHDLSRFNWYRTATYALNMTSLGAALLLILKFRANAPLWLGFYCGVVLLGKITIAGRQLTLEALVGLLLAVVLTAGLQRLPRGVLVWAGICSVAGAFIVEELRPDMTTVVLHDFNWLPFNSQMTENVSGMGSIIDGLCPFVTVGFFAVSHIANGSKLYLFTTGLLLLSGVMALEYAQSGIAGRYPDITTVILAVVGWSIPLLVFRERSR